MIPSEGSSDASTDSVGASGVGGMTRAEEQIQKELARSMRMRARAMTLFLGFAALNIIVLAFVLPGLGKDLLPPELSVGWLVALLLTLLLLETALFWRVRDDVTGFGTFAEPLVGALEVTAITGFMVVTAGALNPPHLVLVGPGPWLYFTLVAVSSLTLRPRVVLLTGGVATLEYILLAIWLLPSAVGVPDPGSIEVLGGHALYYQKAMMLMLTAGVSAFIAQDLAQRIRRIARRAQEHDHLVSLFGQHVAPEVVEALMAAGGQVAPERRNVAILFLDIRGFTGASEKMAPEQVVARLDRFFSLVLPEVTGHGGIVHQLLGDGFMAIFGAPIQHPDDAARAIRAALSIHALIAEATADGRIDTTDVVMGVHFGDVVVGPVGAADHKEYKATGDAVNVAARLETMAKELDASVLSSRAAVEAAGMESEVLKDLGEVPIRGRLNPLRVLQLR